MKAKPVSVVLTPLQADQLWCMVLAAEVAPSATKATQRVCKRLRDKIDAAKKRSDKGERDV